VTQHRFYHHLFYPGTWHMGAGRLDFVAVGNCNFPMVLFSFFLQPPSAIITFIYTIIINISQAQYHGKTAPVSGTFSVLDRKTLPWFPRFQGSL